MTPILGARIPIAAISGRNIVWEFYDSFSIADAAPLADPLPADMLGSWDVTADSGGNLDVTGGAIQINGSVSSSDPRLTAQDATGAVARAREAGLASFWRGLTPAAANKHTRFGFDAATSGAVDNETFRIQHAGAFEATIANVPYRLEPAALTDDVNYDYAIILRATGAFYFIKGGTQFPAWTLVWVDDTVTSDPVYMSFAAAAGAGSRLMDFLLAGRTVLGGAFASAYGLATDRLAGSRSAGDTFSHTADFFAEFVVTTLPSSGQIEFWFRIEDANNYWSVTIDSSGDLDLDEVVASTPTQRGTAAAVVANGERVCISVVNETIQVFDAASRRIQYTSASNFKAKTAGELDTEGTGGAVDDIIMWPATSNNFDKYFVEA